MSGEQTDLTKMTNKNNKVKTTDLLMGFLPLAFIGLGFNTLPLSIIIPIQALFLVFPTLTFVQFKIKSSSFQDKGMSRLAVVGLVFVIFSIIIMVLSFSKLTAHGMFGFLTFGVFIPISLLPYLVLLFKFGRNTHNYLPFLIVLVMGFFNLFQFSPVVHINMFSPIVLIPSFLVRPKPKSDVKQKSGEIFHSDDPLKTDAKTRFARKMTAMIFIGVIVLGFFGSYFYSGQKTDLDHPRFITANFIEIDKIELVSKFRSQAGHEYVDFYEEGWSMKHYFQPSHAFANASDKVKMFSPADGVVNMIIWEGHEIPNNQIRGFQVQIIPKSAPFYKIIIYHVNITSGIRVGSPVKAGDMLGYADTRYSNDVDIAISYQIPFIGMRYVSYFATMDDNTFADFLPHHILSREDTIIPRADAEDLIGISDGDPQNWMNITI